MMLLPKSIIKHAIIAAIIVIAQPVQALAEPQYQYVHIPVLNFKSEYPTDGTATYLRVPFLGNGDKTAVFYAMNRRYEPIIGSGVRGAAHPDIDYNLVTAHNILVVTNMNEDGSCSIIIDAVRAIESPNGFSDYDIYSRPKSLEAVIAATKKAVEMNLEAHGIKKCAIEERVKGTEGRAYRRERPV